MKEKYDLIVIGFAKAGKTLAGKLAKGGKSVALIEKDASRYGGTCINVGCIPSKRLVTDAQKAPEGDFAQKAAYYQKSIQEKRQLITALRKANYDKLVSAGVDVIDGEASFVDAHQIQVTMAVEKQLLSADQFVINTGALPVIPSIEGIPESDQVYLSESLLDLETLPERLTIVGGGYIGLEFASMYASFGSKVTVISDQDIFLPREDEDVAEAIEDRLHQKGVSIIKGAKISRIAGAKLFYEANGSVAELDGDAILLATGRRPNTDGLACEKAGVKCNERGAVITDSHQRTSQPHIWAGGDVCGKLQFTYISLDDSRIILDSMQGKEERSNEERGAFSYAVFIDPPFARVGLSEKEAKAAGISYRLLSMPAAAIPKAKVLRKPEGLLKALVDEKGKILGAALFCAEAHEMINLLKLAMDQGIPATVLRDFIFTHPTISEGLNDLFSL